MEGKYKEIKGIMANNTQKYTNTLLSRAERERLRGLSTYKILAKTAGTTPSYVSHLLRHGIGKQRTAKSLAIMRNAKALLAFVEAAERAYLKPVWEKEGSKSHNMNNKL